MAINNDTTKAYFMQLVLDRLSSGRDIVASSDNPQRIICRALGLPQIMETHITENTTEGQRIKILLALS